MNTAVTDYLAHLEVERRMSAHTLDAYRRDLAALSEWAQAQGIVDLETLQPGQLRAFVAAEHRRGLSPKSLQRRLSACRSWFQWLLKNGRITLNPRSEEHTSELQSLMRISYDVFCLTQKTTSDTKNSMTNQ